MRALPLPFRTAITLSLAVLSAGAVQAADPAVLNLYSARHYQTDEALYSNFTKQTGIRIQRVDADDAGILARLKSEGASSPADVVLLVDAARLWRAEIDGLFQPVHSPVLEAKIPPQLRGKDSGQGSPWFGFSTRARMVIYNKQMVSKTDVDTYEKLANPKLQGKLCTRSGSHPYNLSLFGAMTERLGAAAAENWLKGLVTNMARTPKGGDTDQIKATATGECGVALVNSYYLARMLRSNKAEDRDAVEKIGYLMPDQAGAGTHMNIAGGAVARYAQNRDAAVKFLEYLASDAAQAYFADGNNEWPVVKTVKIANPALDSFGAFKTETTPVSVIGMNQVKVQQMLDRVGYK